MCIRDSPDDEHPVTDRDLSVPDRVHRGLHVCREDRTTSRDVGGQDGHRSRGHHVTVLVRMKAEHALPDQTGGVLPRRLDDTHADVSVLHGRRKRAVLEGRPHLLVARHRHLSPKDERLGAPTDPRIQRSHQDIARTERTESSGDDLSAARLLDPEFACSVLFGHVLSHFFGGSAQAGPG